MSISPPWVPTVEVPPPRVLELEETRAVVFAEKKPRKRFPRWRVVLAVLATPVALLWLEGLLVRLPSGDPAVRVVGERIGVIHVHTKTSGGSGSLPEVINAARSAHLSFLAITDHNIPMDGSEGADDPPDFAIIDGEEVSTYSGHFLALGVTGPWQRPPTFEARSALASSHRAGGVNFLAHPFGTKERWRDWGTSDFDGMEILNSDAVWRENSAFGLAIALILYPVNPQLAYARLAQTPAENLAKWDELNQHRKVAGICGADAHAAIYSGHTLLARFPSYLSQFRLVRQHVLLPAQPGGPDPNLASDDVLLQALKNGNSFCALDGLFPSSGFTQQISSGGRTAGPGDSVPWTPRGMIDVSVPGGSSQPLIRVLRDGQEIFSQHGVTLHKALPGPGRYRVEVYLRQPGLSGLRRWTLWIFANPTYVSVGSGDVTSHLSVSAATR